MPEFEDNPNDGDVPYGNVDPTALRSRLIDLIMLGDDAYLSMQAMNLGMVDTALEDLERALLRRYVVEERTPLDDAAFLSALSQMWLFAAYELLRTWRQRVKDAVRWHESGTLEEKIAGYRTDIGFVHHGRLARADLLQGLLDDPGQVESIRRALRATHILFSQLSILRMSIAKHEEAGKRNSVAFAPGYGRINMYSGSLDYELSFGRNIMGNLSRRDVADSIRAIDIQNPQEESELASYDEYVKSFQSIEADPFGRR